MSGTVENRKYSRSSISLSVQVRLETGVLVEGRACNVSLNGLFFETERSLPLGSCVSITMTLGKEDETADILSSGVVSRLDGRGVAIELSKIDAGSLDRLCVLIQKTALDTVCLKEELERWIASANEGCDAE
ncbi:MAG: PilZ domain-containing protein [Candidatus Hydrogenedentes bacterium]|nr:PilZ domain-containing protein [Candidatus Hydrogenedentota bacterium]